MALTEYKKGSVIHSEGDPILQIALITAGELEATFHGQTTKLEKADFIGLCGLSLGSHFQTYTAASDVTLFPYPCEDINGLESLIRGNADIGYLMVNSMCRQIAAYMQYMFKLKQEAGSAFELIEELYPEYERLCKQFAFTPKKLPGLSEITAFSEQSLIQEWTLDYYMEIKDLDPATHKKFFFNNPGITSGFLRMSTADMVSVVKACTAYMDYIKGLTGLLLDSDGHDLFSIISELHISSINIKGADETIETLMEPLTWLLSDLHGIDQDHFQIRLDAYGNDLAEKRASTKEVSDVPVVTGVNQSLQDSLDTILTYSGCAEEISNRFKRCVQDYTNLPDRKSADDEVYELRKELTSMFYELYQHIFVKYMSDSAPPTVIKMFLNFGYVDAALAGYENADYLYSIVDSIKGDPSCNVYTICEWLTAVYKGEKEPSLSEFEMDYPAFVRDLKQTQKLDDKAVDSLLKNQARKLRFEMENVFPVVNRVTFGNPSKFCPLFADHNVVRKLEDIIVDAPKIKSILDEIRSIDFSAFFRETSFSDHKIGVPNELVNVEVMPNIILMPNVGIRGSMWQEIEGRVRTTPARMFMPMFLENDLKATVIRLTGEFRWEMCKRIQGSRWNDLSDPSLTSLFSDYLQFYMNNRNLSMQTMLAIRNEISSARNNFKTVFVGNYSVWLLNESKGSARLNGVAINVLMTFCPFVESIREYLGNNLRYAEPLNRYRTKQTKRVQHLQRVHQKVKQGGKEIPQELLDELEYAKR